MKALTKLAICAIFSLLVLTSSESFAQDEIYYSPSFEEEYIPSFANEPVLETASADNTQGNTYITNNYNNSGQASAYADVSDYGYSSRIRRFYSPNSYSYFNPYYIDQYYYTRNPDFWGQSIYSFAPVPTSNIIVINNNRNRWGNNSWGWNNGRTWGNNNSFNNNAYGNTRWNPYSTSSAYGSSYYINNNNYCGNFASTNFVSTTVSQPAPSSPNGTYTGPRSGRGSTGGSSVTNTRPDRYTTPNITAPKANTTTTTTRPTRTRVERNVSTPAPVNSTVTSPSFSIEKPSTNVNTERTNDYKSIRSNTGTKVQKPTSTPRATRTQQPKKSGGIKGFLNKASRSIKTTIENSTKRTNNKSKSYRNSSSSSKNRSYRNSGSSSSRGSSSKSYRSNSNRSSGSSSSPRSGRRSPRN